MQRYRRKDWLKEALVISLLLHILLISGSFFMKIAYPERSSFKVTMYNNFTNSMKNNAITSSLRHHFNETLGDVNAKNLLEYSETLTVNSSLPEDAKVLDTSNFLVESLVPLSEVGASSNTSASFYNKELNSISTLDISVSDNFVEEIDDGVVSLKNDNSVLPVLEGVQDLEEHRDQLDQKNLFTPQYSLQLFGRNVEKEPDFSFLLKQELYANVSLIRVRLSILPDGSVSEIWILGDGSGNMELDSLITESLLRMIFNDISLDRNTKQIGVLTLYFS